MLAYAFLAALAATEDSRERAPVEADLEPQTYKDHDLRPSY
jgi:hypothetical protein